MGDWTPPEVAAKSWEPPEVANPPEPPESPQDEERKAEVGAGEAGVSLITGAAASVPAGVRYLGGRIAHTLAGGLGYGLAAGDPEKTRRVTEWLQKKADEDTESFDNIQNFWTYAPRAEEGQRTVGAIGDAVGQLTRPTRDVLHDVGVPSSVTNKIPAPGPGTETALDIAGGAVRASSAFPALGLAGELLPAARGARAASAAAEASAGARAAEGAKPAASAAVTADQLRAQPNPIPPPNAPEAATAPATLAVQKPKVTAATQEPAPQVAGASPATAPAGTRPPLQQGVDTAQPLYDAEVARLAGNVHPEPTPPAVPAGPRPSIFANRQAGAARIFHPPAEDGPQYAARASEPEQAARQSALDDVNRLGGGLMSHDRRGAVTGDWNETGNEHQTAKMPDAPGQLLRDQIATEHQTLHNATQNVHDSVGSEARNDVDRDTAEQRGGVVRGAVHAIEDHFNRAADGMYQTARATLGDTPMASMPRVQQILSDGSHDVNPTAASLRRAAQTKLQQLWSVGDTRGNVKTAPGSVGAAERFHEFLNDSYHNDSSGLIRKLKNATDTDVAERAGGNDMFQAARNVIQHRETMLEPDGVNELRRPKDRNKIDHEVPLHEVMDHVVGQDREHFEHFMNVLRAGAHLSPEVAEKAAAAIREIQGHMIAKMHSAARGEAGQWNATNFYKAGNRFSTNLPAAFRENPKVLEQLQTINRAGNILKMDKSYPGAVAQAAKVGLIPSLAMKAVKGAKGLGEVGGLAHGNVVMTAAAHLGGKALEKGVERMAAGGRLARAQESLIPRGGKERGSVGVLPQRDAIKHEVESRGVGRVYHSYKTPTGGYLNVTETPGLGVRQSNRAEIPRSERGQGWGTRMLQRAVDDAHEAGQVFHSDGQVSGFLHDNDLSKSGGGGQVGAYKNLAQLGYNVKLMPHDNVGGELKAVGDHVFEVRPKKGGPGNFQRGSVPVTRAPKEYQASDELSNFVHAQAPAHRVDPNGPATWEELQARRHEPVMPVNPQSAEGSIYKDVPTNIAFRAWHDKLHLDLNAGFDHEGELRVAQEHQRQAERAGLSEEARRALWADTWETFKHHESTGEFPSKPREFVAQQMANRFPGERGTVGDLGNWRKKTGLKISKPTDDIASSAESAFGTGNYTVVPGTHILPNTSMPSGKQRGSAPILNIGHNVGDPQAGGRVLSKTDVARALAKVGAKPTSHDVLQPDESRPNMSDPTSVVALKKPLSEAQGQALARQLGQKAIAQNTGPGEGSMFIPKEHAAEAASQGWDKYNPDYFHMSDGRPESAHLADFNPAELEGPHPNATVKNAQRSAYPGIYDDPKEIMSRVKTAPEDPILRELFGTTRKELHDIALSRGDVSTKSIPGVIETKRATGSAAAKNAMTDENAERLRNTIAAFKDHDESAYHGMVGWYVMDQLHRAVEKVLGKGKAADAAYSRLNHFMGMASPGSDVVTELKRGTAAHMMDTQGRFNEFEKYGGQAEGARGKKFPTEMEDVPGHPYHSTAQAGPMRRYVDTGAGPQAPKTSMYVAASERGKSPGFQNKVLVGDSHFSRGFGLSDVRTAKDFSGSISGPELRDLHPWYHEHVAKPSGLPATSAQAVQWGALSHETGVETPVGAPKLELFAQQVKKAAERMGITPKEALTRIIKGVAHAG